MQFHQSRLVVEREMVGQNVFWVVLVVVAVVLLGVLLVYLLVVLLVGCVGGARARLLRVWGVRSGKQQQVA